MGKVRIPSPRIDKSASNVPKIAIPELHSERPQISFQFLDGMSGGCLESLYKVNKSETKGKLKELQKFINDFSNATNLEEACKLFSGKTLNISSSNGFVNNVIKLLHKNYPKLSGIVEDELAHIHAKRQGKGETVYFGFKYENVFNIIYIDSNHSFDK